MARFHVKDVIHGEAHRTEVAHGEKNGRAWHRFTLTLVRRTPGKWDSDTKEYEVYESYIKITFFGKEDEINKLATQIRQRDVDSSIAGDECRVSGYAKCDKYNDQTTGEERVAKTPVLDKPEFDWQYYYANNTVSQQDDPTPEPVVPQRPATPITVAKAASDDLDLDGMF